MTSVQDAIVFREFKKSFKEIEQCILYREKKGMILSPKHESTNAATCLVGQGYLFFERTCSR